MATIAMLMKNENTIGTTGSQQVHFTACLMTASSRTMRRDCTAAVWRYRLCGITTAPRMPVMVNKSAAVTSTKPYTQPFISSPGRCGMKDISTNSAMLMIPMKNSTMVSRIRIPHPMVKRKPMVVTNDSKVPIQ